MSTELEAVKSLANAILQQNELIGKVVKIIDELSKRVLELEKKNN